MKKIDNVIREEINHFLIKEAQGKNIDFMNSWEFYAVDIHEPEGDDVCGREYFDNEDEAYEYAKDMVRGENLTAEIYFLDDEDGMIESICDFYDYADNFDWIDALGSLDGVQDSQVSLSKGPVNMDDGRSLVIEKMNECLQEIQNNNRLPNAFHEWARKVNVDILPDLMDKCEDMNLNPNDKRKAIEVIVDGANKAFDMITVYNLIDVYDIDENNFYRLKSVDKDDYNFWLSDNPVERKKYISYKYNEVMSCFEELAFYFGRQ